MRPGGRRPAFTLFRGTLDELAARPRGRGKGRLIVTPNVDHLRLLSRSHSFRRAYAAADVVLNDSRALDRSFIGGTAFCLTGADLAREMLDRLADGAKLCVIGCPPTVEAALGAAYPRLRVHPVNPSMGYVRRQAERRAIVACIMADEPDCVLVCTGAPQSEIFAAQLKRAGCDADILCCGSGLLFLAGQTPRAPLWMQRLGCEWLFCFFVEPRTRKRYAKDALFLLANWPALMGVSRTGIGRFPGFDLVCRG